MKEIDNSFIEAADLTEVNRILGIDDHNIPGKTRRSSSYVKDLPLKKIHFYGVTQGD